MRCVFSLLSCIDWLYRILIVDSSPQFLTHRPPTLIRQTAAALAPQQSPDRYHSANPASTIQTPVTHAEVTMISSYRYYNIVAVYLVLRHAAGLHFSVAASSHNPAVPAPHIRRSQHAKLAARLQLAQQSERRGLSTLVSGTGDGTFYYDVNGAGAMTLSSHLPSPFDG